MCNVVNPVYVAADKFIQKFPNLAQISPYLGKCLFIAGIVAVVASVMFYSTVCSTHPGLESWFFIQMNSQQKMFFYMFLVGGIVSLFASKFFGIVEDRFYNPPVIPVNQLPVDGGSP
jgi:hypothetical protein